jgi:hypothetical protein
LQNTLDSITRETITGDTITRDSITRDSITQAVIARLAATPDARIKEVMTSLVQHLHAFAREVKLTESEWQAGIQFLTTPGQTSDGQRQEFVQLSDMLGLSMLVLPAGDPRLHTDLTHSTKLDLILNPASCAKA